MIPWNKDKKTGIKPWLGKKRLHMVGELHWNWKGGKPRCLDCDKELKNIHAKRCKSCVSKIRIYSKKHKENISKAKIGKPRLNLRGENHPNWKGGITPIKTKLRNSLEYEEWRKKVFERDLYTCQDCGEIGNYLHADHIKSFSEYPKLRFDIHNGRTLCVDCHFFRTWNKIMPKNNKWGHKPQKVF